jgi:hypothetical protein
MGFIKKMMVVLCFIVGTMAFERSYAQASTAQDMQQLLYDIEKLTQFKSILADMKTGYTILTQGYGAVKAISEGNFTLHSTFLNSLETISPSVRQYGRIADIIANQGSIVSECKSSWKQINASGRFTSPELFYINSVFTGLLNQSIDNLNNLVNVISAHTLRMSDAERLQAIDHIYADTQNKLSFLRHFHNQVAVLSLERAKAQNDLLKLKNLY